MDRVEHAPVSQSEQSPVNEEIHSRGKEMNNDVAIEKAEDVIIRSSIDAPLHLLAGDFPMVETTPSKQIEKGNDEEGQITLFNSKDGVRGRKRRNCGKIQAVVVQSPSWLPETWTTIEKYRESGSTAGTKDKYYVEPKTGRQFRSRREVEYFLKTGEFPRPKGKLKGPESRNCELQQLQALDIKNHEEEKEDSKLDGSGNPVKRRKLNDHLTGAIAFHNAMDSSEIRDGQSQRLCESRLAFPSTSEAQGKPGISCMHGQLTDLMLAPSVCTGVLSSNSQLVYNELSVASNLVNLRSCSVTPGSLKVVPVPAPSSPCSVLPAKQLFKAGKRTRKLKVCPQEMRRHLVALGRKLCGKVGKKNMQIVETSSPPMNVEIQIA